MPRWWASLATKVLGLQLAGLLTIAGVVGVTRYYSMRGQLYREVGTSAENLIQVIEETVAERPELLQPGVLDPVVDRFTYKLPAVARVSVVDPTFTILADSRLPVGQASDQTALLPLLRRVDEERFYYVTKGDRYLRLSRSLRGRYDPARRSDIVGAVSIDMALAPADAAIGREMVGEMALVMGLLIPISAVFVVLTRHRLIRPLARLQEAGVRFARGEAPAPVTFSGSDELEEMGRTFNEMVEARTSALKERERQLAAAQAIAHVGSWEWDIPANHVTWSDELYRMYGVSPATPASYEGFQERVHADDRERVARIIARGLADRVPVDYEWRLVRLDGETRHMLGRNITLVDDQGVAVGLAGTTLDVTERKRADEALGQSEAYHRALIEQALDIITIIDADAVLRYLSPSVERVLGYSQTELVGQRAFEFMHPDDLEATLAAFTEGIATPGVLRRLEYRFRHKDGSWRYLEGVGRNLLDDPLIKAVVVNARDVSERKAAEENQRTLLRELQAALAQVKTLQGWIKICANCKRVLNDAGVWEQFESYVHTHAGVDFSHGICPECAKAWSAAAPEESR